MTVHQSQRYRLCCVGPMVGRHPGLVTTQGEILAGFFRADGYPVVSVSDEPNRYRRLVDIIWTIIRTRQQVDIQFLNIYGGPSFVVEDAASLLARLFGHRIVMVLRGGEMPVFSARFPRWTRRVLARADVLIAPSPFLARAVESYGFTARVIPNAIDLSLYRFRHRTALRPKLFWMRTFHPIYNPMMAVRVLARLRERYSDATLVMGGGDLGTRGKVEQEAHALGLNGALRITGFLKADGKAREGGAADIFINTNDIDNMPVAVVEACAMGLPIVATDAGGVPDLLTDGVTGLIVPCNDDERMASAIERLLKDPNLAGKLSQNGRRLSEESSWQNIRPQWQRLFEELMSRPDRMNGE